MQQINIPFCPVVRPKFKEFNDFKSFVEKLDAQYKNKYGMVKVSQLIHFPQWEILLQLFQQTFQVVPPKEWIPRMSNYQKKLENLVVQGPIQQNVFGKGGVYECLHIPKKSMTLEEYKAKAFDLDKIVKGKSIDQIEAMFWKNIAFSPPLYGADLINTLMDGRSKEWNLNQLDSLLRDAVKGNVKGVTSPYCYVGSWKALFCWHTQDLDLSAINFLHIGKPKFWYAIHHQDRHIIQAEAKRIFGQHFAACSQFLRHKTTLISPYFLKKKYPQLRINKMIQEQNQFILVFGGSYHSGFNFGYNIAEAVNYATMDWLRQLPLVKSCQCSTKSVKVSIYQVYSNLSKIPKISSTKKFLAFQQFVFSQAEKEQSQEEFQEAKRGVKDIWTKKIKKSKKTPKKIMFNNEEYEIDNWVQCDRCNVWRKLSQDFDKLIKRIQAGGEQFNCKKIGKQCHKKDKIDKKLFTLEIKG